MRCANRSLTVDGMLGGSAVELTLGHGLGEYFTDRVHAGVAKLSGDGSLALAFVDASFTAPGTTSGSSLVHSPNLAGGAWLCGEGTLTFAQQERSLAINDITSLGSCASLPAVSGAIEVCDSARATCKSHTFYLESTVDGVAAPAAQALHTSSGQAPYAVMVQFDDLHFLAPGAGEGLVFSGGSFGAGLCAEHTTLTMTDDSKTIRFDGLHRLPASCAGEASGGPLFICAPS